MFEGINPSSMKRILPALVFILLLSRSVNLYSQIVAKGYSTPVMQAFQKGKTFAVLTNDETFNQWFRQALQKQWTINQLQFITAAKLDSIVSNDKNFFLFAQAKDEKTGVFHLLNADDLVKKKEFFVMLSQGGAKQSKLLFTSALTGPKILGSFRYGPDRAELTSGMMECEMLFSLLNQSLQVVIENKIKNEVKDSVKWVISDGYSKEIKDKVLLINRSYYNGAISLDDNPLITDKVLEDYPWDYLIVGKDSVAEMFNDPSGNYCYLFLYFPGARFKKTEDSGDILVYDPRQKKFLYFDDNLDGPWIEKWKMKALVAAAKRK